MSPLILEVAIDARAHEIELCTMRCHSEEE
jgi:hypothetical protein